MYRHIHIHKPAWLRLGELGSELGLEIGLACFRSVQVASNWFDRFRSAQVHMGLIGSDWFRLGLCGAQHSVA